MVRNRPRSLSTAVVDARILDGRRVSAILRPLQRRASAHLVVLLRDRERALHRHFHRPIPCRARALCSRGGNALRVLFPPCIAARKSGPVTGSVVSGSPLP